MLRNGQKRWTVGNVMLIIINGPRRWRNFVHVSKLDKDYEFEVTIGYKNLLHKLQTDPVFNSYMDSRLLVLLDRVALSFTELCPF
jgi:hypothetical protein